MYRLFLGTISALSQRPVPSALTALAPDGPRRQPWLAGRAMLHYAVSPLPAIHYGDQGKPEFDEQHRLWFNLSHSGDRIALLLSDEGPVGCDLEVVRPHPQWTQLANTVFTTNEHKFMEQQPASRRLETFWRVWTRKEAMVKQRGGSVWQIVSMDSLAPLHAHVNDIQLDDVVLAVSTPTPLIPTPQMIETIPAS